ncbi:MAG TPA: hypothetical protein VND68_10490 [Chloroflexia bacterium]|jgi:hypothetical protein|nr:hypothetical protein [Chloroflexia bacterium]
MRLARLLGYGGLVARRIGWVLLVVALGSLLSGCVEVMSSPAPKPLVISTGLGAARRDWEHKHRLDGPFEAGFTPARLRGLVYDGTYKVTYWADGPQEEAPASARISRIEFGTSERDTEALKSIAREFLPEDAVVNSNYGPDPRTNEFTEVFLATSLMTAYEPLAFTDGWPLNGYGVWATVAYSEIDSAKPHISIQISLWDGIPPEGWPPEAVPTFSVPVESVVYR